MEPSLRKYNNVDIPGTRGTIRHYDTIVTIAGRHAAVRQNTAQSYGGYDPRQLQRPAPGPRIESGEREQKQLQSVSESRSSSSSSEGCLLVSC